MWLCKDGDGEGWAQMGEQLREDGHLGSHSKGYGHCTGGGGFVPFILMGTRAFPSTFRQKRTAETATLRLIFGRQESILLDICRGFCFF